MEGLTKENFWNELHEKHPEAVDIFCKWIDHYKKEVCWNLLMGDGVKFHDLPFEMQAGIIERFKSEMYNKLRGASPLNPQHFIDAYKKHLTSFFRSALLKFVGEKLN